MHWEWLSLKVVEGERPVKPEGATRVWFTDDLWKTLNLCWATQAHNRPSVKAVLKCLEEVSGTWIPVMSDVSGAVPRSDRLCFRIRL